MIKLRAKELIEEKGKTKYWLYNNLEWAIRISAKWLIMKQNQSDMII